jgi:5-methylcytosine-specific restriction endonuclease McrA
MARNDYVYAQDLYPSAPRGICRVCRKPIPSGDRRRTICSAECRTEFKSHFLGWGDVTRAVAIRDKGVCADCGMDCERLDKILSRVKDWKIRNHVLRVLSFNVDWARSLWEAHHVKPVKHNGPARSIDELITLCVPCHRKRHGSKPKH